MGVYHQDSEALKVQGLCLQSPKSPRRQDLGLMVNLNPKPRLCPVGFRAILGLYEDNGKEKWKLQGSYRDYIVELS